MNAINHKLLNAKRKMLEAEVELLENTIAEALHWVRINDVRESLLRIRKLTQDIAKALDIEKLE